LLTSSTPNAQSSLRSDLRKRRRQLNYFQQHHAATRLCRILPFTRAWQGAKRIAFYQATGGEIDPARLFRSALRQGKQCFLPVLHPFKANRMLFVRVHAKTPLQLNRWGIPEPVPRAGQTVHARQLNLVLVPLVGFDRQGHRIGMGKGYYDRTFAFRQQLKKRPLLAGLAHDCQRVEQGIEPSAWDVRMDVIFTPSGRVHALQ
tara:strand:+ start:174334 stop:174942 length:609 start_codon:yes stop_codon:yes gene_type:complete